MNLDYNTGDDIVSFLEFGAICSNPPIKKVYAFKSMQQAYDWFMNARYSNDLITYVWMNEALQAGRHAEIGRMYRKMIHHPDDFSGHLAKWAALQAFGGASPVFYEHGQTLFGCIEGIEFCDSLLRSIGVEMPCKELTPEQVNWVGYDISEFFNSMARRLHHQYAVTTSSDFSKTPQSATVVFAKGVTLLYALRSNHDFFDLFGRAQCGLFDISFSCCGQNDTFIGTGKQVCFLPVEDFLSAYRSSGRLIFVRRNACGLRDDNSRLYLEGIVSPDADTAEKFIQTDAGLRNGLVNQLPDLAGELLHVDSALYTEWQELSEFLAGCEI